MNSSSIGVMSVATNIYLEYWKTMVLSADAVTLIQDRVTFFVFTDAPAAVDDFKKQLKNVEVRAFETLPYRWPDATLLRYQIFDSQIESLNTDLLMHLDADMQFRFNPWDRIKGKIEKDLVCLVEHPGYWRPSGKRLVNLYISHPLLYLRDLRLKLIYGNIGAWERNHSSKAYVKKAKRKKYYCGGTWFGERIAIGKLIRKLKQDVVSDQKQNLIAIWHDESHLNKWATENNYGIETPELCFFEKYKHLNELTPVIVAVEKTESTR